MMSRPESLEATIEGDSAGSLNEAHFRQRGPPGIVLRILARKIEPDAAFGGPDDDFPLLGQTGRRPDGVFAVVVHFEGGVESAEDGVDTLEGSRPELFNGQFDKFLMIQ